ncbi:MAG TPA: bis(5'-nucleosyl)-tetraphosphatase (symmetrical) YqeK [Candidatus Limnocylindrales bacterium]|nr:bis(5'-nucleosyl)-tetraphosphatase (symmetrical) YqeK [Candidatus Limnocylindrales bacterium]
MKLEHYRNMLKERLNEDFYRHSLSVAETAYVMAEHLGADTQKAYLAGLLHDYGKRYTYDQLLWHAKHLELHLDWVTRSDARLMHAPVGAALLKTELDVSDAEVIDAVAFHTTGRPGMSLLEKIIYISDYIEIGRDFEGVEVIRLLSLYDLNKALLAVVEQTIGSVLKRRLVLHPRSVEFRNSLLKEMQDTCGADGFCGI